jgi:ABC-2 type transport system permease protein
MRAIGAIVRRNLLNFVRDKGRLIGTLIMAFAFLFIFSFVMKSSLTGVTQPMNYLISGIIIMTVFQSSLSNSTDILTDIASGFMKEILVAPISRAQISIGQILSSSVIAIVQGLIISVISLFMGLNLDAIHFIEMIGVMAVAGLTFGSIGLFLATIARNSAAFQVITMIIVMPLTFLSGAYIPTTIMPSFLRPVIYINPLTYITSIFRFITLKLNGTPAADLVKQGIAYNIHGFIVTPILGFFMIILIGLVFFSLCVYKFNKADFSNVKVSSHH